MEIFKNHRNIVIAVLLLILMGATLGILRDNKASVTCKDCNLIVIAITNVSAEHVGSYGYFRDTTPNIDRFAEQSLLFENAFAHTSWTLASAASVFTSQYPYSHGIWNRSKSKKLESATLAEVLKSAGFRTAAFTGGGDYNRVYGLNKGFDTYIDSDNFVHLKDRLPLISNWLEENGEDRFFLYVQGFDTHCPFNPLSPYDKLYTEKINEQSIKVDRNFCLRGFEAVSESEEIYRTYYFQQGETEPVDLDQNDINYLISQYDGEISMLDDSVGVFLDQLDKRNLLENSIVVIYAEHGEMFEKNGRFGRAGANRGTLYDEVIRVPLIIRHPNINEPQRIDNLVQLIDLMPSVLDFLNVEHPNEEKMQGKSLLPMLFGGSNINEYIYAGTKFGVFEFDYFNKLSLSETIRNKEWKLIHEIIFNESGEVEDETYELYNIAADPKEQNDLSGSNLEIENELREELFLWAIAVSPERAEADQRRGLVPESLLEEARKRGYQ